MAINGAFMPCGKTAKIVCSAAAANNITMTSDSPCQQYMLANHTSQPVYLWLSANTAPVTVTLPTGSGANAGYAVVIPPNSFKVITGPQISSTAVVQASAIAETGTPDIYITPGEGV